MATNKHLFALTFLMFHYLMYNINAQESSNPSSGDLKNMQDSSYRDWLYNINGSKKGSGNTSETNESPSLKTKGNAQSEPSEPESNSDQTGSSRSGNSDNTSSSEIGQDTESLSPESNNTREHGQNDSENSRSQKIMVQNGLSGSKNPNVPSSNPESTITVKSQQSRSRLGETGNFENNSQTESSKTGSNEAGNSNISDFENEPLVYEVIDFVLNPVEGFTKIFLKALRRTGSATIATAGEIGYNVASLASQVGGVILKPTKVLKLTSNIVSGSADLTGSVVSRFAGVAADVLNETSAGLGKSVLEGRILVKNLASTGFNATNTGANGVRSGAIYVVRKAYDVAKNYIVKDCVWYRVGLTNSCIPFRIWKLVEFPLKFTINTAILPVKIAINSALLPIEFPIIAVTVPVELAIDTFKIGEDAAGTAGIGAKFGFEGVKYATPYFLSGTKTAMTYAGQFGTRLLYHARRFVEIIIP